MTQQSKQLRRFNRLVGETDAVYHELANRLGLSDSAFQILYTLRAEGSVTTESSGARHKTVTLTTKGAELAEKTVAKVIEIENEILGSWPAEDLEKYIRLTEEFLVSVRARAQEVHS